MKPHVSILLPSYNHEKYISRAIDSVIAQSFRAWELIIIDDGSTDKSPIIIEQYKDDRIKFFKQSNKGVTETLNRAIKTARGEYICFLDSDDKYHPRKLELQLKEIEKGFDIVTTKVLAIDGNGKRCPEKHFDFTWNLYDKDEILGKDAFFYFLEKNYFCKSSLMLKRELFDKYGLFNTNLLTAYDLELWLKMIPHLTITRIDSKLTYYRWHGNNETIKNNKRIRAELLLVLDNSMRSIDANTDKNVATKYLKYISNCFTENNLYKGYLSLQLLKRFYNLEDNYELLKIKDKRSFLFSTLSDSAPQDPKILILSNKKTYKENIFQKIRRRLIPLSVREFVKNLFLGGKG